MQVASGTVRVNDVFLESGDGTAISDEARVDVVAEKEGELLLFDLA